MIAKIKTFTQKKRNLYSPVMNSAFKASLSALVICDHPLCVFLHEKKAHHCDVLRVLYVFDYYLGNPLLNLILQQIDLDTF